MADTEADTCRKLVVPKLHAAGWTDDQISEQKSFTDGRIIPAGQAAVRRKGKRADFLLRYTRDFTIAVVEAKRSFKLPGDGIQQAKDYAETLGLKFAYSTNGMGIVEHDYTTGRERTLTAFPGPAELWARQRAQEGIGTEAAEHLLAPSSLSSEKAPRYYQEIAINRAVGAIAKGQKRVLLTLATGTGKTFVAFQIIWKLWSSRWNRAGEHRKPRVLYLADRVILIDKPKDIDFAPLGDARSKIEGGEVSKGREVYFAIYQAIANREGRPGLYQQFPPDFFDLIVVDECHRGSAKDESNWHEILEYFEPAFQLGMTATPLRDDNVDTYRYFGNPVYTYSLRQGIEDGFLAPYRVQRIVTTVDAAGWRPTPGEVDRFGHAIPDELYETKDFETIVKLKARTETIAKHIAEHLRATGRMDKTIVFCVDQEHAEDMRLALSNANADLVREYPDYVVRIVADEGQTGRGHLWDFTDVEQKTPVIVTTSRLLSTGVDVPTCRNVALVRPVGSMTEFKQIIGRGTRVRADYGKYFFTILDYVGDATRKFADPDFDGQPALVSEERIDTEGRVVDRKEAQADDQRVEAEAGDLRHPEMGKAGDSTDQPGYGKFYVDGGRVEIAANVAYDLDPQGHRLRAMSYQEYTRREVGKLYANAAELKAKWATAAGRSAVLEALKTNGIALDKLADIASQPDADPFDLLCYVAFSLPLRTRRERAEMLRRGKPDLFAKHSAEARQVLNEILDKYVEQGVEEFRLPDILKVPPVDRHGTVAEIAKHFGGETQLRAAVLELQSQLYLVPA
ncbi:MAG: DEAD/DEAH box helicase family protein [Candidatus Coatesbacteria bacterium]